MMPRGFQVACLSDSEAHLAVDKDNPFKLQTKPHGHGDVHSLLYGSGLLKKWVEAGVKWVAFFQDTNALVFRGLPAALGELLMANLLSSWTFYPMQDQIYTRSTWPESPPGDPLDPLSSASRLSHWVCFCDADEGLCPLCEHTRCRSFFCQHAVFLCAGVSVKYGYDMNSLAVPRRAKEAIGGIAALRKPDGNTLTINVEYNLLDPLLRASGWADGDVNDDTGYSPYPGAAMLTGCRRPSGHPKVLCTLYR